MLRRRSAHGSGTSSATTRSSPRHSCRTVSTTSDRGRMMRLPYITNAPMLGSFIANSVLVMCAATITGLSAWRELQPRRTAGATHYENQPDWLAYAAVGNRIGRANAKAVIVEFA